MDNTQVVTLPKGPQNGQHACLLSLIFFLLLPGILLFVCKRVKKSFSNSFPLSDMAIVASSSSSVVINNEVFISFRGDTRKNFTSHLYSALRRKGIWTYRDDPNLERGDEISPALSTAIEESKISIVVFSKEYASSRWCLDELVHILKCKNERARIVLPVFYDIDPSDIRKQKGSYADAFAAHKKRFGPNKVKEWRDALTAAADLSGFDSKNYQYESELIEKIVKDVLRKLKKMPQISFYTKGLVGIEQQLEEIESLLCFGLPNPRVIGLWGLGGIGKTTLAIEIFNRFSYRFENCCFLQDVRENSEKHGLPYLESKLFSKLLEKRDLETPANSSVRDRLHNKAALTVLDDVDNIRQLDCLLGDGSWFGPGSKVIITTRDAQLLKKDADKIHQVKPLDFDEALELFYLNAFKTKPSITRFIELSEAIVTYTGGNPLALKILGSSLHSQTITHWEHTWNKLKIIPNSDIQKVLKISYDGLDDTERDIFLDIACFLKGERRNFIESILDNCGFFASSGIDLLINKSLITIPFTIFECEVWMHDLIQEMGWEIVRQQSIRDPGERSRLWIPHDVYNVLQNNRGTKAIEGIYLDLSKIDDDLYLKPTVFNEMHRLRLLKIYTAHDFYDTKFKVYLTQGLEFLPPSLRYLYWYRCPLKSLPSDYKGKNLVELHMRCSKLKQLWSGVQNLGNLKHINLGYSKQLIKLPDLSRAPKLKSINLEYCVNLVEVPPLNFQGRDGSLTLRGCIKIKSLPKILGNLKYLNLDKTEIEDIPSSIVSFENLVQLSLCDCKHIKHLQATLPRSLEILNLVGSSVEQVSSSSIEGLDCLRNFDLGRCEMLESLPANIFKLKSLEKLILWDCSRLKKFQVSTESSLTWLDLSGNSFENIPSSIIQLHRLKALIICRCKKLRSLPQLPSSVSFLNASGCTSLETISSSGCYGFDIRPFISHYKSFTFLNCWKLGRNARSILTDFLYGVDKLNLEGRRHTIEVCYPGNEIPKWFRHQGEGASTTMKLPHGWHNSISTTMKLPHGWHNSNLMGFAICIVAPITPVGAGSHSLKFTFDLHLKTKCGQIHKSENNLAFRKWHYDKEEDCKITSGLDHVLVRYEIFPMYFLDDHPDAMEVSFYFKSADKYRDLIVKRIGVGLVYECK